MRQRRSDRTAARRHKQKPNVVLLSRSGSATELIVFLKNRKEIAYSLNSNM